LLIFGSENRFSLYEIMKMLYDLYLLLYRTTGLKK
jgi:hypothetical protein